MVLLVIIHNYINNLNLSISDIIILIYTVIILIKEM